jgi:hypothetical protein
MAFHACSSVLPSLAIPLLFVAARVAPVHAKDAADRRRAKQRFVVARVELA